MLINMHTYKSLKLFLIIPAVIIISIAAGISVKAAFTLNISTSVANSDTQINLNWTSVADSVYYKVARDNTVIKIINVNNERNFLSYSDNELLPETTYNYTITAVNSEGKVIQTASKTATTTQMKAPSIVSYYVDLNKKSVTINWVNNSKAVRETSVIKLNDDVIAKLPDDGTSITFIDPSLEANKAVKYTLISSDGKGHNSPHSSVITVIPVGLPTITAALYNNQIKISWGPNADIDKFVLERSEYLENSWGPWTTIVSNIKKNSTYDIDTSAGNGTYRYRLSINTETFRGYSNISNPVTRILSPKNLHCVPVSARRIDLSWTNPQGWDYKLKIERRKSSSKDYTVLSVLDSNISSYSDTDNIEPNQGYYYRITAFNEDGISASSSEYYIYTGPPTAAHSLSAEIVSYSKVILNWNDNSDNELGFIIERKSGSEDFTKIAEVPANVTTYTDGTLSADKTYTYRVIPYNPYGNAKSYTKELSLSTSLLKDSPASLTATALSTNEIELTWSYEDLGNYATAIERKSGSNGSWEIVAFVPVGFTSYNDTALTDNNQYYYRVKAILKEDVYSKPYPNNDIGIAAHTKLKAPQNLKASWSSSDTIRLTWLDKSYGAEYFVIERKIGDSSFVVIDTISADEGNTWYDHLLKPGSSYTYRLKSIKGDHSSDYSDEVTVEGYAIPAPSNLKAVILSESKIKLTWEDNSNNETNFIIEQKTGSSTAWKQIGSVKSNITSFTVDKLKPDVKYTFRVKSYNSTHFLSAES
ncbi:MAG TPA: fibronectin type III domain-containing protein, partial [Acetivibrio clariflavus]|nr:fibronectin type III domain-containing protein [Acetivibrio clariflavus]